LHLGLRAAGMAPGPVELPLPPQHRFAESQDQCTLTVDLLTLTSLEGVLLDISNTEVRLALPGEQPSCIVLPPAVAAAVGPATAKFSKRRGQLTVSWQLPAAALEAAAEEPLAAAESHEAEAALQAGTPAAASAAAEVKAPAYGSIWNANSWHWEEKNCLELARAEVRRTLAQCEGGSLRHIAELDGASVVLKDVQVKGDASISLRKGKRIICFELSVSFRWECRDEFGSPLGAKGTGAAQGLTQEEGEGPPEVLVEVSASSGGGREAKAAGQWMQRQGARILGECLQGEALATACLAAEAAKADLDADQARRAEELAKMAAARRESGQEQARIAAERQQQENARREAACAAEPAVQGSVWNVNAWHWEERPMTEWSLAWLRREIAGLTPVALLAGLATAEFSDLQISGDASISVRKGKPIVLFQFRIHCHWAVKPSTQGLGEARGTLCVPEFSSEEGAESELQLEVARDDSRGRLVSAFRRDVLGAAKRVLAKFVQALGEQLPRAETPA